MDATESVCHNPEARAARLRGILISSCHGASWPCFTLFLLLVQLSSAYAQTLSLIDESEPPSLEFGVSAQPTFPMNVRITTIVDPRTLPTNLEEGLGTVRWEISGEGKLWDEEPGTLELRFGNRPTIDSRSNFVEYSQPDFRLTLGEQRFSLSPLVRGGSGLGVSAQGTMQLAPELDFDTQVQAYTGSDGARFGLRMAALLLAQSEASINVLANPSGPDTLLSGQLRIFPEIEGLKTLDFEAEYGLQLGDAPTRHALNLSASLTKASDPAEESNLTNRSDSVSLSYRQTEAGYRNSPQHSSRLRVDGSLQLNEAPKINASVRLRQEVQHEVYQSLSDAPERYNLLIGGTLSGDIEGVALSLGYENHNEVRNEQDTSSQRNDLSFGVGLPISDNLYMYQSLEWQQDVEEGALYETLLYSIETDLPVSEGNLRPQVAVGYDIQDSAFDALDMGASYFGLITDTFDLFAGSGFYLADETFFYLIAGGSYGLEGGQVLSFDASVFLFSDLEPLVNLSLGYGFPVELPLRTHTTPDDDCCSSIP